MTVQGLITPKSTHSSDVPRIASASAPTVLLFVIVLAILSGCQETGETLFLHGYVEGEYVYISPEQDGRITEIHVRNGQQVDKGDPLFRQDEEEQIAIHSGALAQLSKAEAQLADLMRGKRPEEIEIIRAKIKGAEAELDLANLQLQRQMKLENTSAQSELDAAKSRQKHARANVMELRAQLKAADLPGREQEIRIAEQQVKVASAALRRVELQLERRVSVAPLAGIIEDVFHRKGEVVMAGAPVISLLPDGHRKIRFFVPEVELSRISIEQEISITCDGCPRSMMARTTFISSRAEYTPPNILSFENRQKLVFLCEAVPGKAASRLKPGQPVDIRIAPRKPHERG